jgi:effector-binding domain-containing protein
MDFECQFVCELRELVPVPALTIRMLTTMGKIKALFDEGYREIADCLAAQGLKPEGPPFAAYYNMGMNDIDVEFGFPVVSSAKGTGRIMTGETPSGKAVTCLYIGPYNEVEPAYDALMKWIDDNHFTASGTAYEIYLNDPASTPSEMLKTQVHLLLNEV